MTSSRSSLEGVRVVELGEWVAAPYCAKLLADLGAEVIKVEPTGGDPARSAGPIRDDRPDPETSGLFVYLNTSKRGMVLDLDREGDLEQLRELLTGADLLIDNHAPGWLEQHGLGWDSLQQLAPRLSCVRITPYGLQGPRSDTPGDELTLTHASGLGNLLPTRSTDIDRAPVKLGGHQVGYHSGVAAALAALAALRGTDRGAPARLIDVSMQEVMLAMASPYVTGNRYQDTTWSRVPDRPPAMGRVQTRDGYVILNALDDHHFRALRELMGEPDWCSGDEWLSLAYRTRHLMEIAEQIDAWALTQDKHDLHEQAGRRGIPIGPINDAAEVLDDPQFAARDYFVEVDHPRAGRLRYPGWPYQMSASPARISSPAPLLGLPRASGVGWSDSAGSRATPDPPPGNGPELPLAGVRVLEMCWVWAGPYAGYLLACLGADVIKLESHRRTDLMRRTVVWPLPEPKPLQVPPTHGMAFNSVNMNKRSVTLDLSHERGRELARRLAGDSDVVIDNLRPGALDKLGLGYDGLRAVREDLIVASSSGRGRGGPFSEFLGYAMVHQAIAGGAHITGYPDDHPCHSLGDVDLMNATTLAVAILAALRHRDRTGEGQFIDYSQCEGVSSLLGEVLLEPQLTGRVPDRMGNAHPQYAPHGVYRAWGVDRWLAIEVHDDEQFGRLAETLGRPELAEDSRFATAADRKTNESVLDDLIEAWTKRRDRDRCVEELTAAGVCAAPSRDGRDLYADSHLRARGAFVEVEHPELGPLELVGPPFQIDGLELPAYAAPALGADNQQILSELLDLSDAEIATLREEGVIAPES